MSKGAEKKSERKYILFDMFLSKTRQLKSGVAAEVDVSSTLVRGA
jgi:hypothetical protein